MSVPAEEAESRRDLRGDLIREATRLFGTKGYSGTSIRHVAEACECTKPAVYYHFRNKAELFRAVVEEHVEGLTETIREGLSLEGSMRSRLSRVVKTCFQQSLADPTAMRLLHRASLQPEDEAPDLSGTLLAAWGLHLQLTAKLVEQGIANSEIRADLNPEDCAIALAGSISLLFDFMIRGGEVDMSSFDRVFDLLFEGIAKR